jgi:drug/metabolite transporter (DMT)-like permease
VSRVPFSRETIGLALGLVGMTVFGGTLPFTRLAVEGLSPGFVTAGRAALAGILALVVLIVLRRPWPDPRAWIGFAFAALCLAGIFPVLTAIAMQTVPASHGGVVLGIMPLTTALAATLVAGERPSPAFWAAAVLGAALVVGFALHEGAGGLEVGDLFLFVAVLASSVGYVISAQLAARGYTGWEVISWVVVVALPVTIPVALWLAPADPAAVPGWSWVGFGYVTLMSQYLGFFAWNAGLALGGIARVSQVQLLQTFVTLIIAAALNGERVGIGTWLVATAVVLVVLVGRQTAIRGVQRRG